MLVSAIHTLFANKLARKTSVLQVYLLIIRPTRCLPSLEPPRQDNAITSALARVLTDGVLIPHALDLSQALERMWRTSKSAADSTGNRMPEESFAARMLVDAARDGNFAAVTRLLKEQNWPPHVLTRMGHASGCAALPSSLDPSSLAPKPCSKQLQLPSSTPSSLAPWNPP